jgi:hypothetical protein
MCHFWSIHYTRVIADRAGSVHSPRVSAATGRARSTPEHRLTDIDAGRPHLDQNLTGARNRAGHVTHLEDPDHGDGGRAAS